MSAAVRFALELWADAHPDTTHIPDPDQLKLDLDEQQPKKETVH